MDKKVRRFDIEYDFRWEYSVEIKKIREDLGVLEELGATHIEMKAVHEYDDLYMEIVAYVERMETDEEYHARILEEKRKGDARTRRDLEQLRLLQKKYGKEQP